MKTVRIIPRLDVKGTHVVKGIQTEGLRIVGDPAELASSYYRDGADEILYMDIVASLYGRNLDFDQLKSVANGIFIPLTVGGGIRSIQDINNALRAGADKVAINTFAVACPEFLQEAVHYFGSQCIILSVEAKRISELGWEVYTEGGRERTSLDVLDWVRRAIDLGVGEIIVTSIDQDGSKKGYDIELVKQVADISPVPVIAHGGAGTTSDILHVIRDGGADAVSASSLFHYSLSCISDVKHSLSADNIPIRII